MVWDIGGLKKKNRFKGRLKYVKENLDRGNPPGGCRVLSAAGE